MPENKKLCLDINVRFRDLDAIGHVNHLSTLTYFEEGRIIFLRDILGINLGIKEVAREPPFIMASLSCEFLSQISLGDEIFLELWIVKIHNKSFTFKYRLRGRKNKDKIFAIGESTHVFFDFKNNQTMAIPIEFSEKAAEYLECKES